MEIYNMDVILQMRIDVDLIEGRFGMFLVLFGVQILKKRREEEEEKEEGKEESYQSHHPSTPPQCLWVVEVLRCRHPVPSGVLILTQQVGMSRVHSESPTVSWFVDSDLREQRKSITQYVRICGCKESVFLGRLRTVE